MGLKRTLAASLCVIATLLGGRAEAQAPAAGMSGINGLAGGLGMSVGGSTGSSMPGLGQSYNAHYNSVYKSRLDSLQGAMPLPYNDAVQDYIDIFTQRKAQMGKMMALGKYYFPIFEKVLKSYGLPKELKYLPVIESQLSPTAVSRVGATGLWQFMYSTAKGYRLNIDELTDERRDPLLASQAAAAYFRDAYNQLGDWLLAVASYNCGTGAVQRAVAKAGSNDFWEVRRFLPKETQNYVPAFIAAIYVMNYGKHHQIEPGESIMPVNVEEVMISGRVSLARLADALGVETALLNKLNPSCKGGVANASAARPRKLVLPGMKGVNLAAVYNIINNVQTEDAPRAVLTLAVPAQASAGSAEDDFFTTSVRNGQTLQAIARLYDVTLQDLKVWNNLKSYTVVPGQQIKIYKHRKISEPATKAVI